MSFFGSHPAETAVWGHDRNHIVYRTWPFAESFQTYFPVPVETHLELSHDVLFSFFWGQPEVSSKCFRESVGIGTMAETWQDVAVRGLTPYASWHSRTWHSLWANVMSHTMLWALHDAVSVTWCCEHHAMLWACLKAQRKKEQEVKPKPQDTSFQPAPIREASGLLCALTLF